MKREKHIALQTKTNVITYRISRVKARDQPITRYFMRDNPLHMRH
jgi:hypothetical protein